MTIIYKIYEDIFNKSRFLAQDNYFTPFSTQATPWQTLAKLDDALNKLPVNINHYVLALCSLYQKNRKQDRVTAIQSELEKKFNNLNPVLKKVCEVYAIGLLVCDDLLTRINFLNINKKTTRTTIPTISYNNVCQALSSIGSILYQAIERTSPTNDNSYATFQLLDNEVSMLNNSSKLLTTLYNSSALGIFRKQPTRRFSNQDIAIQA